jgi:DNA invertase Pin-like site-specific DNA recombinase
MRIITKLEPANTPLPTRKRVAAYARVSSGKDAQLQSLSAQISYYSAYIQRHGDWEYCGVYADEALTGTKEERPEFQRLLADCRIGEIDMVITKAISRFARNTVTMLETVRELKLLGVDVYFEKQQVNTQQTPQIRHYSGFLQGVWCLSGV